MKEVKPLVRKLGLPVILLALSFTFQAQHASAADTEAGKKLFKAKCASCHAVKVKLTGPALMGWSERVPAGDWIYSWVNNSPALIASGDEYANQIFDEYNGEQMTAFPELSAEDVDNILAYVDEAATAGPAVADGGDGTGAPVEEADNDTFLWILVIVLFVFTIILSRVVTALSTLIKEQDGEELPAPLTIMQTIMRPRNVALVVIVLFIGGCYNLVDNAWRLGTSEGYQPIQPIAFSHKIHAGVNKIDCQYCHSNADKSQHATIPSVNVCMNCHKAIQEYSGGKIWTGDEGTDEIKKMLTAYENNEPIEWIKIHDLPDHVYFNHSQHVNVGEVECQTCHGPVEEMDEVYQFSPLSMGWCIDCHRETEVGQFKDNNYYAQFTKLHEEMANGSKDVVTVEKLGGTECQKCHY